MTKAIRPPEALKKKSKMIPDKIIEAFNQFIIKYLAGRISTFTQKEIVKHLIDELGYTEDELFNNHWLDVENTFRQAHWEVNFASAKAEFTFGIPR